MARRGDDAEARLLASRELGKANRAIHAIRNSYIANRARTGSLLPCALAHFLNNAIAAAALGG